jgi:hypothetical protein
VYNSLATEESLSMTARARPASQLPKSQELHSARSDVPQVLRRAGAKLRVAKVAYGAFLLITTGRRFRNGTP